MKKQLITALLLVLANSICQAQTAKEILVSASEKRKSDIKNGKV